MQNQSNNFKAIRAGFHLLNIQNGIREFVNFCAEVYKWDAHLDLSLSNGLKRVRLFSITDAGIPLVFQLCTVCAPDLAGNLRRFASFDEPPCDSINFSTSEMSMSLLNTMFNAKSNTMFINRLFNVGTI